MAGRDRHVIIHYNNIVPYILYNNVVYSEIALIYLLKNKKANTKNICWRAAFLP